MGTFYGLNRYDGHSVKAYTSNHTKKWALKSNLINHITEDENGLLWISTEDGLAIMDPLTERIVHLDAIGGNQLAGFSRKCLLQANGKALLYQELKTGPRILLISPRPNLLKAIRKDQLQPSLISVDTVPLPKTVKTKFLLFYQVRKEVILLTDTEKNAFEYYPEKSLFVPIQLENYGSRYNAGIKTIFDAQQTKALINFDGYSLDSRLQMDQQNELLVLPDGSQLLFRFYNTRIFNFQQVSPQGGAEQLDILPPFILVDQPMSAARLIDRQGNIWVGTTGYGARKITRKKGGYQHVEPAKSIYNFVHLPDNTIWLGCFENQRVLDYSTGTHRPAPWTTPSGKKQSLGKHKNVVAVLPTRQPNYTLLVEGDVDKNQFILHQFNAQTQTVSTIPCPIQYYAYSPPALLEAQNGFIWIAGLKGEIIRLDPNTNTCKSWNIGHLYPTDVSQKILARQMVQDAQQSIWIASDYGIVKITNTHQEPEFKAWHNYTEKGPIFSNNNVFCLYPDPHQPGIVWLGTLGSGLARFDTNHDSIKYFTEESNPNLIVSGMVPDHQNNLWLSSNKGISCFNMVIQDFLNYHSPETFANFPFNVSSCQQLPDGQVAFGGSNGLLLLQPSQLLATSQDAKVYITSIKINNTTISPTNFFDYLEIDDSNNFSLTLSHNENNITISLAAPDANNLAALQFRYRIKNQRSEWSNLGQKKEVSLAGLPPGRYTLELQLVTLGHTNNKAPITTLELTITPPWYLSWYAYLFYSLLLLFTILAFIQYDRKRLLLKHEAELSRQEMTRLGSLEQLKSRFFAYIAHEFRTPLTIIMGMSELIKQSKHLENPAQVVEPIIQESNNLLHLIEEILDVSRLQDGSIQLHPKSVDLPAFIQQIIASYQPILKTKNLQLEFLSSTKELFLLFDPLRMKYLLNNLLSNAIRYSYSGGTIQVELDVLPDNWISLKVRDFGEGIPPEYLPSIFDKYFRADQSENSQHFGLGLSFVSELVTLMRGSITVHSTPKEETTFHIKLPLEKTERPTQKEEKFSFINPPSIATLIQPSSYSPQLPLLLIVDDNFTILSYLQLCLQPHFNLLLATNGKEGLEIATQEIPDLILTDAMMPIIDGLEMTQQLKKQPLTSHIPIVMLSARSELNDRLNAQNLGADIYLAKPFHHEELLLILQNLFQLQQKWKNRYENIESMPIQLEVSEDVSVRATDEFIQEINHIFEENYSNEHFDAIQIAKLLHISKTQLYRKLASISDQTAMELLRNFRLQKAMELLSNNPDLSIKQVTYMVGFKERSHFSNIFIKKFNIAPSDVKKRTNRGVNY